MIRDRTAHFWSKVDKSGECWIWKASTKRSNNNLFYGQFWNGNKVIHAHRYSYEITYGPTTLNVGHKCDNGLCVRPEHLFACTQKENMHDSISKGRWKPSHPGECNGNAKLSKIQVDEIRRLYKLGGTTIRKLAPQFGVSKSMIAYIVKGEFWRESV